MPRDGAPGAPRDDAPRAELPTDPWSLPPMGALFEAALEAGLRELGLAAGKAGSERARRSYEAHARLLRDWGSAINLTAIREPADVARRHVCDSLSAVPVLDELVRRGTSLLDLGSGAGYPGLPLCAALPLGRVGLLDAVAKKFRFLGVAARAVTAALETPALLDGSEEPNPDIVPIAERAEDLADEADERATWDIVTARAVGPLSEVLELALPLLREGGNVVAWKREGERSSLSAELRDAGSIIRACGGGRPEVVAVQAGSLPGHRLIVVRKLRPTPATYPRSATTRRRRRT
jgi:16S rRNA (guanine527-N7)-methyltransferase